MSRYPVQAEADFRRAIEEMKREKAREQMERQMRYEEAAAKALCEQAERDRRQVVEYAL